YSTYDETEYTKESWAVFAQALEDAQAVLANEAATQEEVDAALETLKNAASGLTKAEIPVPVDKNAIKVVAGIYSTYDETEYTKESWAVFAQALEDAQAVLANEAATQEEVDAALETLKNAASGLTKAEIPVPVDKNAIKVVAGIYKTYDETEYTKESWAVIAQALEDAQTVLANEAATQEEVDAALETLKNAASGLTKAEIPVPVDKNAIKVVAGIYKTYDETEYTKESWTILEEALKVADQV